ncbi:MAG: cob(I)yrinic acid a,c-diamide adenosyltransferase [Duncaniella sp.]|nr:cob(I)yrinic acid a,c-diamide adenosyltransferase [Duncaniella sp.]
MAKSLLYTRTGDSGMTSLYGGSRIAKNSLCVDTYGTIDELNSFIGLLEAHVRTIPEVCPERFDTLLLEISSRMFDIGAFLSTPPDKAQGIACINTADISLLEEAIDGLDEATPAQKTFILPGGSIASSHAQVARAVCRRAERRLLDLRDSGHPVPETIMIYVNRLSDFLFIFARYLNSLLGIPDIPWQAR